MSSWTVNALKSRSEEKTYEEKLGELRSMISDFPLKINGLINLPDQYVELLGLSKFQKLTNLNILTFYRIFGLKNELYFKIRICEFRDQHEHYVMPSLPKDTVYRWNRNQAKGKYIFGHHWRSYRSRKKLLKN